MADVASPELEKRVEDSIPVILAKFFPSEDLVSAQEPSSKNGDTSFPSNQTGEEAPGLPVGVNASSQQNKIFLDLTTKAFTKPLTKEKLKDLSASYPQIKGTESFMPAATTEAGMKEESGNRMGIGKPKRHFSLMTV